ncbi:MAG: ComF family protein [Phycisphaerae bacterium]
MAGLTDWTDGATGLLRQCAQGLIDLVLPQSCHGCQMRPIDAAGLCELCSGQLLELVSRRYCSRCGSSLGQGLIDDDDQGCYLCPSPQPRFRRVARLGPYRKPLRSVIGRFKYRRIESMRDRLCDMLARAVEARLGNAYDMVQAVPMHWSRRLVRGFDHASRLAGPLADKLSLPLGDVLVRTRPTPPQVALPRKRRLENVRGAFAVRRGICLDGLKVLLVDDVTTTGATASEAAAVLKRAGAIEVDLAVLAKADPPRAYAKKAQPQAEI